MSPTLSNSLLAAQSDRRLVELVGAGHERAFEVLVQRYRNELLRYCRRMGLSDSRAEDAVQHALLQAWLALERGVEVRELRPWLYRIVHNTAVNIVRRSPEDHRPLTDAGAVESATEVEFDLERAIAVRDALTDVAALPPMQREAIILSAMDGRSHDEVASALGITHGAVRGLLYRARSTLRGAAAALTPQPLISWLCGGAARVAPSAERLAELSSQGGGAMSGALVKGAALAVTAVALAAGAAVVPHHGHAHAHTKASARPAGVSLASTESSATRVHSDGTVSGPSHGSATSGVRTGGGVQRHLSSSQPPVAPRVSRKTVAVRRSAPAPVSGGQPVSVVSPGASAVTQSAPAATVASSGSITPVAGSGEVTAPVGSGGQKEGTQESGSPKGEGTEGKSESDDGSEGSSERTHLHGTESDDTDETEHSGG
jgi:RNA polymerase sigma factor (sigma-70 family)